MKEKRLIKNSKLRICTRAKRTGFGVLARPHKGYNKKESGEGGAGHVYTDEQKARISAARMGKAPNPSPAARYLKMVKRTRKSG